MGLVSLPEVAVKGGVVGLDLSLRCAAALFIPADWELGKWDQLPSITCGYGLVGRDPEQSALRLHTIAQAIVNFVKEHKPEFVGIEEYAFGLAGFGGMALGELGGAVKAALYAHGYITRPINASTARKLFLGKLPRKGSAVAVHTMLKALGAAFKTADVGDALVIANWARSEIGLPMITCGGN